MTKLPPPNNLQNRLEAIAIRLKESPNNALYHEQLGDLLKASGKEFESLESYLRAAATARNPYWPTKKAEKLYRHQGFAGRYSRYPDLTGKRQAEGGSRMKGEDRAGRPSAPLVSVVTVVYNNPDNLQRCIDSVVKQSYDNIEHIIIDGGSQKETLEIISSNEGNISYFVSEPDRGVYDAMNKGIGLAHGSYICLLNSDDFYHPDFITSALKKANRVESEGGREVDIVYTDYFHGDSHLVCQEINEGILFGHLNICHNTFLARSSAYDRVGLFETEYCIVSDAIWMRKAFLKGLCFRRLNEPLFTLTEGGLSSGNTEARRELFISEVARSYQKHFPQIDIADAREIYLFRFNKARIPNLLEIVQRYGKDVSVNLALRNYASHCLRDRSNFRFSAKDPSDLITSLFALVDLLKIDIHNLQFSTHKGHLREVVRGIDSILELRKCNAKRRILHFISVFSAPSETFVYDLLSRLEAEVGYDNYILFEHSQLRDERPYAKSLFVPWSDFHPAVATQIYKYIIQKISPTAIIAHFALNEWKWSQRIASHGPSIPTLAMCHGIDAFAMRSNHDYKNYLVNDFSHRHNTAFTAVSNYLADELRSHGIPNEKITLVHNTVNSRFFSHRKTKEFYDGTRQLKLISIGRLVRWKGHHHLLSGLATFCANATRSVHLTLVYGRGDQELKALQVLAEDLGIADNISFIDFIDFNQRPDFLAGFDIFVHPSTYSEDGQERSETFGVSLLEAIAAGLPIITTDAGGLPEVVGETETRFARVVPHGDAMAIARALEQMWRDGRAFANNLAYATEKLECFSSQRQVELLEQVLARIDVQPISAALFSYSTIQGAGYAAYRLHRGFQSTHIRSTLFTTVRNHENQPGVVVVPHPSADGRAWQGLQRAPKPGLTIMTLNHTQIPSETLLQMVETYDVINLHWYARFLSAENIAALTWSDKPVVMTIRDMLPLTGACHYFHGCDKWKDDCALCPQMEGPHVQFPSEVLAAKRANYNFDNLTLVTLSQHTRRIVEQAPHFRDCRIETIPNSIELDVFRPHSKREIRVELGLPQDRYVIAYVPSFSSEVKGYRQLMRAFLELEKLDTELDPFVLLIGNKTPATEHIRFDKKTLGYISDNAKLSRAYAAADVVVVPSLEETFSNTTAEAIASGTPVVGFRTGAIPELAVEGISGITCEIGDTQAFARGLLEVLRGPDLGQSCRVHAEQMLAFPLQANRYEALFAELVAARRRMAPAARRHSPDTFEKPAATILQIALDAIIELRQQ